MANYDRLLFAVPVLAALLSKSPAYAGAGSTGGTVYTSTDLGTVATSIQMNGAIDLNSGGEIGSYTYNQLLFLGNYLGNQVTDSNGNQTTVGQILANDLGPANNGSLAFHLGPGTPGGSGTLAQNSSTSFSSVSDPAQSFTFTASESSTGSPQPAIVGTSINLNPLDPARTVDALLAGGTLGAGTISATNGTLASASLNLPSQEFLGVETSYVSIGGATFEVVENSLYGEINGTTYQNEASGTSSAAPVTILTWDPGSSNTGGTDGLGNWTTSNATTNWWNGSNAVTYWINGDTAIIGSGGAGNTITLTSAITADGITFNTVTSPYSIISGGAGDDLTINGIITLNAAAAINAPIVGASALTITGTHTLTLSGANTYTGGTTIEGGATVNFTLGSVTGPPATGPFGTGTVTLDQGTLHYGGISTVTLANNISVTAGTSNMIGAGGEQLTLTGDLSGAGALELTDGTIELSPASGGNNGFDGTLDINGGLTNLATFVYVDSQNAVPGGGITLEHGGWLQNNSPGTLIFNNPITVGAGGGIFDNGGQDNIFNSAFSGAGNLIFAGTGTEELRGFSTGFTGNITIAPFFGVDPIATVIFYNPSSLGGGTVTLGPGGAELEAGATLASPLPNNIVLSDTLTGPTPDIYSTGSAANNDTLSGVISDAGGVHGGWEVTGGGTLELAGANTYSGGTAIGDGTTVVVDNSGTLGTAAPLGLGDVSLAAARLETINALDATVASGIQINIGGNYTQDAASTLVLTISGSSMSGHYDAVKLNGGNASLAGLLLVQFNQGYVPTVGDRYTVVSTSGTGKVTGQFSDVSATNEPFVFTQDRSNDQSDVLVIDPPPDPLAAIAAANMDYIAVQDLTFESETVFGQIANQFAGVTGFDTSGLAVLHTPDADPFTIALNSAMQSIGRQTRASAAPDVTSSLDALNSDSSAGGVVPLPAQESSSNCLAGFITGDVIVSDTSETAHYTTGGVIAGVDYNIASHLAVGLLFSYGYTGAKLDNNGSALRNNRYSPGVYFGLRKSHFYFDALAGYTFNAYRLNRNVTVPSATASSAPNGNQGDFDATLGYNFHVARGLRIGPAVGMGYTHLNVSGCTESGAGMQNMTVSPVSFDSLRSLIGGRLRYDWRMRPTAPAVSLTANTFWQHEGLNGSRGIIASFASGGSPFLFDTPAPERDSALLGLGISGNLALSVTVFVNYEAQIGQDHQLAESAMAGVAIALR